MSKLARPAAWIALASAVAAVAALVVLVIREPLALPVAIAGLAAASAAGWFALARRGAPRVAGAVVAIVAIGGCAAGLVLLGALAELVVLVCLTAAFVLASRAALRRAHTNERPRTDGTARSRAVLLMNPKSGGGKVERFELAAECRQRGIEPVVLRPGDDLAALARAVAGRADVIGMAGGDGSQALVAGVAHECGLPFVCIPAGTRNHLALDLGLDRDDVVGALDAFVDGVERTIDLAFVNDRIFVNNVSLGIYAKIVQSESYRDAKLRTVGEQLPELLGPDAEPFDLRFSPPDGGPERSAQLVLVSNNRYVLDRLFGLGSRPRLDAGELGIIAVEVKGAAEAAELVSLEAVGQARRFPGWLEWSAATFDVGAGGEVAAGVDGESIQLRPPLRFRVEPAALRVLLPPTAAGLSPAALTPRMTAKSLGELVRIARTGSPDRLIQSR